MQTVSSFNDWINYSNGPKHVTKEEHYALFSLEQLHYAMVHFIAEDIHN